MIGKFTLVACALFTISCAEPKYVTKPGGFNPSQKAEESVAQMPDSKNSIWLNWEKPPVNGEFASFIVKIGRENVADKSPIPQDPEGEIAVVLWMPSMGHGSSPVTVTKLDTGTYRASRVFFSMPGDWEIRIQRKTGGLIIEEAAVAIRL